MYNRLYIHIPFCIQKCNYCGFCSAPALNNELEEYPSLLLNELKRKIKSSKPLDSIYFGGGTPSLLQPEQFRMLLNGISTHTEIADDAEITMEANPGSINSIYLTKLRETGINRISLGFQSFDDHLLTLLGRVHTAKESMQAFFDARGAGFDNVSIDLMHSLPGQTIQKWELNLQEAINLSPDHISVYGLTIEDGTPFATAYHPGSPELADEDLSADMYEMADEILINAGFEHYEIGNYAKPGFRSAHNSGYWKRDGYLGLGVAAHSFLRDQFGLRFSNPETLEKYRQFVTSTQDNRINEQILTEKEAMAEYIYLGLRLAEGINIGQFKDEFSHEIESVYSGVTANFIRIGLLRCNNGHIALTKRGRLLSNQVFAGYL